MSTAGPVTMAASAPRLVLGLDFGTTYTGIAYCDSIGREKGTEGIMVVSQWPGGGDEEKVPSRIAYTPPNAKISWGKKATPSKGATVHAGMKLKLDEGGDMHSLKKLISMLMPGLEHLALDDGKELAEYPGKKAVDIVSDYLNQAREFAWKELRTTLGVVFDTIDKELVVTVPAVWSEKAKDLTKRAVDAAGFDVVKTSLISEPEAAAIYTLKSATERSQKSSLNPGDVFVVVDCGGGTVDLISYKITQVEPIFQIEEAAVGCGDKCGASFVNEEFLKWLETRIGSVAFNKIPLSKRSFGSVLYESFERAKYAFTGEDDYEHEVQLPVECGIEDNDDLNISGYSLLIDKSLMEKFFDKCLKRTLELIDQQFTQIAKKGLGVPKTTFVVGGFGRNEYLYKRIEEHCKRRGSETQRPKFPWSAVARGAVCRGLELQLPPWQRMTANRRSRKHYGTVVSQPFISGHHDEESAYTDEHTGRKMAGGQMSWLVNKDDALPEDKPRTMRMGAYATLELDEEKEITARLVGCTQDRAPRQYKDDDAFPIGRVTGDLRDVPVSRFKKAVSKDGKAYYELQLELQATFEAADIVWCMLHEGKVIGKTTMAFDS